MFSSLFKAIKEPSVVQRRTDILTVVEINDISKITPNEISATAAKQPNVPNYKPDGAGATLVFHTESGVFVLGGVRSNPALEKELTKENTAFPQQINSTIGGYLANPEISLKDAILDAIKNKMFLKVALTEYAQGFEAQQILKELNKTIENNDGWEEKVCVHTDQWTNKDDTKGTMCYLTAIKHIKCSDSELGKIDEALQTTMTIKKAEGVNARALSAFKFVPLNPVVENSLATHLDDEITKAIKAYENFGNGVVVTFNDLAVATLVKNGAFQFAQLTPSNNSPRKTI